MNGFEVQVAAKQMASSDYRQEHQCCGTSHFEVLPHGRMQDSFPSALVAWGRLSKSTNAKSVEGSINDEDCLRQYGLSAALCVAHHRRVHSLRLSPLDSKMFFLL